MLGRWSVLGYWLLDDMRCGHAAGEGGVPDGVTTECCARGSLPGRLAAPHRPRRQVRACARPYQSSQGLIITDQGTWWEPPEAQ